MSLGGSFPQPKHGQHALQAALHSCVELRCLLYPVQREDMSAVKGKSLPCCHPAFSSLLPGTATRHCRGFALQCLHRCLGPPWHGWSRRSQWQ